MLPFTREQFFDVFVAYNSAYWPAAVFAYPLALSVVVLAWRAPPASGRAVAGVLGLMWAWVGLVYHGLYFAPINPIALAFAVLFVAEADLFGWHAWSRHGLEYGHRSSRRVVAGGAMIIYALVIYPVIGVATGERFPAMPLFGVAPCPLVIFTFGLLLWASCSRWWLWVAPLLWTVIGGSAAILLSVPQDWALPLAALISLLIMWSERAPATSRPVG